MAERVHNLGNNTRMKIKTIGTVLPLFYEWGGEARRERRRWFLFVPYWSTEGASPNFSAEFIHGDGTVFDEIQTNASHVTSPGYRKKAIVNINAAGGPPTSAEWMVNVVLRYVVNGENRTLRHNS